MEKSILHFKEKEIVVPGEIIAQGMDYLPGIGTYRDGNDIVSSKVGLIFLDGRAIKLIPLSGKYSPKRGDTIIGKVIDLNISGWRIDTNCAYSAMLNMKEASSEFIQKGADLTQYYEIGDWVMTKIINVTTQKLIDLTMKGPGLRKLGEGRVIKVTSSKVPRIIGKKGSMVSMIKNATGCRILVGQNGVVWISGEDPKNELIAVQIVNKIERESHTVGLTDRIKTELEKLTGTKIPEVE